MNYKEELLRLIEDARELRLAYKENSLMTGYDSYIEDVIMTADNIEYRMDMEEDDE